MALINADDARAAAGDVVQHGFRHFEADAELLQIRRDRPANVVKRPMRDGAASSPALLASTMALSISTFAFEKPEIGVVLVVENTNPLPSTRGSSARISIAASLSGTSCSRPFFVLPAGSVQVRAARSSSHHLIPAISSRRPPVEHEQLNANAERPAHRFEGCPNEPHFVAG